MRQLIILLVLLTGWSAAIPAHAETIALQDNPPERYVVVKGDTLWGIAGKFLKQPWRWPDIWQMNREQVKNPHWIYPGDVIVLDRSGAVPRLLLNSKDGVSGLGGEGRRGNNVKLSPQARASEISKAIPSVPSSVIGPFLSQSLIIDENGLSGAPRIVATENDRVVIGAGNTAYVEGLEAAQGTGWQVFRAGAALKDPDSGEILGYEARHLGEAQVVRFGNPSTVRITRSSQEINQGDRLVAFKGEELPSYAPHAPDKAISGRIIAAAQGVAEIGQNAIVTINRGSRDGLEAGHVLASYRHGETLAMKGGEGLLGIGGRRQVQLPDERNGLIFVFRTFPRVSYGLVVQSTQPIHIKDAVATP